MAPDPITDPQTIAGALRRRLFRHVLVANGLVWVALCGLLLAGTLDHARYRVVAVELFLAMGVCAWGLRSGRTRPGAALILASHLHLAVFGSAEFGLRSAAGAFFPASILLSGLMLGRKGLVFWTLFVCAMVPAAIAKAEFVEPDRWWAAAFWSFANVAVAWLVGAFEWILERTASEKAESAIEAERVRIAGEIHDSLAQGFTGIVLQLQAAERALAKAPESAGSFLDTAKTLARDSLEEARRSVWALRPPTLEEQPIHEVLRELAERMVSGTGIEVVTDVEGDPGGLAPRHELALLRIGQEAIQNALKHAAPRRLVLTFRFGNDETSMRIEDQPGRGGAGPTGEGLGLRSMRERAEECGGRFTFDPGPGGSRVSVLVPR